MLTREKYDEEARGIDELERKITGEIAKLINKMKSQSPNKGQGANPNSIENKIKEISDYVKRLRKIEADFKKFEAGKPIDVSLQSYNLLATMESNRVNRDDTVYNELKTKLSTSHEAANKLRKLTGTLSAGDIMMRLCEYMKTMDTSGAILTSSYPDVKSYLENNPQQIFELFSAGSGIFSVRQNDCNNLVSPVEKEEGNRERIDKYKEDINKLLKDKGVNKSEFFKKSEEDKKTELGESDYKKLEDLNSRIQKLSERSEDDRSNNKNLERMAKFVTNGIINIRDKSPQLFASLQSLGNSVKNKEDKEKDKKKKEEEEKKKEKSKKKDD